MKAQNGAMQGNGRSRLRLSGSKWSRGGIVADQWSVILITLNNSKIRIGPHRCDKSDPDPRQSGKKRGPDPCHLDPDPQHCVRYYL
jgi:hypothetical protein